MEPLNGEIRSNIELKEIYGLSYRCKSRMIFSVCSNCLKGRWVRIKDKDKICSICTARERRDWPSNLEILSFNEYNKKFNPKKPKVFAQVKRTCPQCNDIRWVKLYDYKPNQVCKSCNLKNNSPDITGNKNAKWKDSIYFYDAGGYVNIRLTKDDPYYSMTQKIGGRYGIVKEHRYVMAKKIGRCLYKDEIVHHINRVRSDNRIENLELISSNREHMMYNHTHVTVRVYIKKLEEKIKILEEENNFLKNIPRC